MTYTNSTSLALLERQTRSNAAAMPAPSRSQHTVSYTYDDAGNQTGTGSNGAIWDDNNVSGYSQELQDGLSSYATGLQLITQTTASGGLGCLMFDGHGSTRFVSDYNVGNAQIDYNYDAFGSTPTGAYATHILYTGECFRSGGGGLYDLRARMYDPSVGRFATADSLQFAPGQIANANLYLYVEDNPTDAFDPTGHGEFSLASLLVVGGVRGLLAGIVIGGSLKEAAYFISTPTDEWSTTGALTAFAKGAASGAFGATLIGSAYFALQGIYDGIQVWRDPKATALQKALASVDILIGLASAYFLKGQVKSQWLEWKNIYSKVPLSTSVQTDLKGIRDAYKAGKDSITIGKTTIYFADKTGAYGGTLGNPGEFYITKSAVDASDETLMKAIIEENVHNGRIVGEYLTDGLDATSAEVGQEGARKAEEKLVGSLTDDIYDRGKLAGWW